MSNYYNKRANKSEEIGRGYFADLLKDYNIKEIEFTTDHWDPIDAIFTNSKNRKIVVEIKNRDPKYLKCDTAIAEVIKYDGVVRRMKEEKADDMWYVCFYGSDAVRLFNMATFINEPIINLYTWKSNDYRHGKTYKDFYDVPISKSQLYLKKDGKWELQNLKKQRP